MKKSVLGFLRLSMTSEAKARKIEIDYGNRLDQIRVFRLSGLVMIKESSVISMVIIIIIPWNAANTASRAVVHQLYSAILGRIRFPLAEKREFA